MHDPERAAGLVLDDLVLEQGTFRLRADVSLRPGALTAIIGPSGAGKSTLLSAIAGFEALTGGAIGWQGAPIDHLPPGQRPVSILFQDNNLFPHLTIAQNIGLAIDPRLRLGAEDKMRIADLLARLGLEGMGTRKPGTLSGGQQSRAALGRVLVADRPIVLLDEPFAALGPGLRRDMLGLAREMLADRTVLMVSHDPDDARGFADETIFIDGGIAHAPRPTEALFAEPGPALAAYLGQSHTP